ncbi:MAG: aminopeptidase P N-terminal domain-containing protein [Cytophagales bacterium]|nr:aminopeptidase P N-terminal domain-containing protein [Cytophagales bacterium]
MLRINITTKPILKEEFAERRMEIMEAIGNNAIAVIQGASGIPGFSVFRQANTFYYLTGLESPHAYLLINGKNKQTILLSVRIVIKVWNKIGAIKYLSSRRLGFSKTTYRG